MMENCDETSRLIKMLCLSSNNLLVLALIFYGVAIKENNKIKLLTVSDWNYLCNDISCCNTTGNYWCN